MQNNSRSNEITILRKRILDRVDQELKNIGFTKAKHGYHLKITELTIGLIDFTVTSFRPERSVKLWPIISVTNLSVVRAIAPWTTSLIERGVPIPTVMATLQKLAGKVHIGNWPVSGHWEFSPDDTLEPLVDDLIKQLNEYAIPWMHRMAKLQQLHEWISTNVQGFGEHKHYVRIATSVLLDRPIDAEAYARRILGEINSRDKKDFWSGYSIGWEDRFKKFVAEQFPSA